MEGISKCFVQAIIHGRGLEAPTILAMKHGDRDLEENLKSMVNLSIYNYYFRYNESSSNINNSTYNYIGKMINESNFL